MFFFQNRHHLPSFWKGFWRCQQLKQLPHISQHFGFQVLGVTHTAQNGATLRIVSRMHRWHRDVPSGWKELPRLNAGYDAYPLQKKTSLYIPPNGKQPENQREVKLASRRRGYVLSKVELQEQSKVATDGGRVWRSSKINRKVVQPENYGKIMGTSNIKACDIRHLPFPSGVVVCWKPQVTASITNKPLGSVCQLFKFWAKKLVFFDALQHPPILQYPVIYGYRICLLQDTHVSFPPKTT